MLSGGFQLSAGIRRDIGKKRKSNQDFVSYFEPSSTEELQQSGCLYVVADGVGGAIRGEKASEYAVKALLHLYYLNQHLKPAERLAQIIPNIGNEIFMYAQQQGGNHKMATTMVVAVILGTRLTVANVGDSRAYLIRGGSATQITNDHRQGENRLTRSVGGELNVKVDIFEMDLQQGDRILLCSDGFHRYFNNREIADLAINGLPPAVAHRMIQESLNRGGADNISVILIDVGGLVEWQDIPQTKYYIDAVLPIEERPTITDLPIVEEESYTFPENESTDRRKLLQVGSVILIAFVCFMVAFTVTSRLMEWLNEQIALLQPTSTKHLTLSPPKSSTNTYIPQIFEESEKTTTPTLTEEINSPPQSKGKCVYEVKIEDKSFVDVLNKFQIDPAFLSDLTHENGSRVCGDVVHKENCNKDFIELNITLPIPVILNVDRNTCIENKGKWIDNPN